MDAKYEAKHIRLGESVGAVKSIKVLNRIITWEKESIGIQADTRHVESAIKDLKLCDAHSVSTPAVREVTDKRFDKEGEVINAVKIGTREIAIQADGRPVTNMASKKQEDHERGGAWP